MVKVRSLDDDGGPDFDVFKEMPRHVVRHTDAAVGRRRNSEWGRKWNLTTLCDFVWDAMEANVAALAAFGESSHPAHVLVRVWCVIGLS